MRASSALNQIFCDSLHIPHSGGCVAQIGGTEGVNGGYIQTATLYPVSAGQTYTFSFYMKVNKLPQGLPKVFGQFYSAAGNWFRNSQDQVVAVNKTIADADTIDKGWQEVIYVFTVPQGANFIRPTIFMGGQPKHPNGASVFSLSDAFLAKNDIVINDDATPKVEFNGSRVHVDSSGNFSVSTTGATNSFTPFFPICVSAEMLRPGNRLSTDSWQMYAQQGFNCNVWAGYPEVVARGERNGLRSGYQIANYILPTATTPYADGCSNTYDYNNKNRLSCLIQNLATTNSSLANALGSQKLLDSLLFYYWDNEGAELNEWNVPSAIAQTIHANDRDANGNRMHPIYQLQSQAGLPRKYNAEGVVSGSTATALSDVVGIYLNVNGTNNVIYDGPTQAVGLVLLNNMRGQNQPVSIAQINGPYYEGKNFRAAVYIAIANGAKGISYFADCIDNSATGGLNTCRLADVDSVVIKPVDQTDWWVDLPALAAAIQSQLSVIRTELSTGWHLTKTSTADHVQAGTRTYQGKGYVIAGNEDSSDRSPTFSITGLSYTPTTVINVVTKDSVAVISSSSFTLPMKANDGGFYILGDNITDALALDLSFSGNLNDSSSTNNRGATLSGNGASISSSTLALSGGQVSIPANPSLEMNNDLTIVAKVNISTSQTGNAAIITKGAGSANVAGYTFFYNSTTGQLNFWYGSGSASKTDRNYLSATVPSLQGAWHTVAVSASLAGTVMFYVDGIAYSGRGTVVPENPGSVVNAAQPVQIGAWYLGHYLQGAIDDVRIYKAVLTPTEIATL
ncbi:MAG TPA: LamG-like jellyroll fold domain-containing protein [Spongiibacteraceae bacterium]|nr:LamG-like jellyroll fold domain-containing protein [Spongiibacteraceae bacterium]